MPGFDPRRRRLLQALVLGGGAAALGGVGSLLRLAQATEQATGGEPHYFIFCYFRGAWDVLLSLDPRDDILDQYVSETGTEPGYQYLVDDARPNDLLPFRSPAGLYLGPYIGELVRHDADLCLVRGMTMDTLTHEVGRRRFLTGRPPSGLQARGSSGSTWLAQWLGIQELIPNLAVKVESYNDGLQPFASALKVNSVSDLVAALQPGEDALPGGAPSLVDFTLRRLAACPNARSSEFHEAAETSRLRAQEVLERELFGYFDFNANTADMQALRTHYGIVNDSTLTSPEAQAAMAVTAITTGVSRCVSVQLADNLDTHFDEWTTDQGPMQARGFTALARMLDDLKSRRHPETGKRWFDHTTVLGFSEFCRSARLNSALGRDHSLSNACFLAGAGIKGGIAVGQSSEVGGMAPVPIDLATGALEGSCVTYVRPENVLQALFHLAGHTDDEADLRVNPLLAALQAPPSSLNPTLCSSL